MFHRVTNYSKVETQTPFTLTRGTCQMNSFLMNSFLTSIKTQDTHPLPRVVLVCDILGPFPLQFV
jgi:hypothetical protein